jgi:4-coumarate--CoA ligase
VGTQQYIASPELKPSGMTETAATISRVPMSRTREDAINSCGQILPGVICHVVKGDGSLGGYGDEGELYVKTPSSALHYIDNEQM